MKKHFLITIFLIFTLQAGANIIRASDSTMLILRNARILNVKKGKFLTGKELVISEGRIIRVRKARTGHSAQKVLDLNGSYIIPGLIDTHIHVTAHSKNNIETTFKHLQYYLLHGITSARDPGGNGEAQLQAKIEIQRGERVGPDLYFAAFMAGDWYYNRDLNLRKEPYHPWEQLIVPGTNLDSAMAAAKACGATGVKIYHSFDGAFLPRVTRAARQNGLQVWGHTMLYPANPIEVVKGGVKVLSHVDMLEGLVTDTLFRKRSTPKTYKDSVIAKLNITEFCRKMKAHDAIMDATLSISMDRNPWVFDLLRRLHENGVKVSTGTDWIVDLKKDYPQVIDEIGFLSKRCGFSNAEAIKSATLIGAEVLGEEKNIGSIEKGKKADLLILKDDPLKNIDALRKIEMVIKNGKIVKR